jgi:hypothetical protein
MIGQSKTGISSQIIFITLFSTRCTVLLCLLPASANWRNGEKSFSWAKLAYVGFSSSDSTVQGHVLNTDGDALRQLQIPAERKKIRSHIHMWPRSPLWRGNLSLIFWMQFDLTQKLELNNKQEDWGHTNFKVMIVTTGRVASSNNTIVGVKPLHICLWNQASYEKNINLKGTNERRSSSI